MIERPLTIILVQICLVPPEIGNTDIIEYARVLRQSGHNVHIICGKRDSQSSEEILDGVVVHRLNLPAKESLWVSFRYTFAFFREICRIGKTTDIDIVHVINPYFFAYDLFELIRFFNIFRKNKIKTVFDVRTGPLKRGLRKLLVKCSLKTTRWFAHKTVVIDHDLAQNLFPGGRNIATASVGFNPQLFKPNANLRASQRQKMGFSDENTLFVYSGTLDRRRNLIHLIDGFIQAHNSDPALRLIIVGDGNDHQRLKLRAGDAKDSGIHFLGAKPYRDMAQYLNAADVGISYVPQDPRFEYQPPLKTIEYLAQGLPVLATNTTGNRRFVNEKNGVLIDDSDKSVTGGIGKIAESLSSLRQHARSSIEEYSWERIVEDRILPVYRSLLR